jgi:uncharacterized membrane protein
MGLGGFVDGIVLHQILQWHHLLSEREPAVTVAGLEANTLADGLFHAATWLLVAGGLLWGWRVMRAGAEPGAGRRALGGLLAGWGVFNLVEGIVDHHILQIHHVRPGAAQPLAWDLGFLALGALLLAAGLLIHRAAGDPRPRPQRTGG